MKFDVILVGTGVAPLVAARSLLENGKSVAVVNPDWDFFTEDSELPLDPLWPVNQVFNSPDRILRSHPERMLEILRPAFPGALESWSADSSSQSGAAHAQDAPYVRSRNRLWIHTQRHQDAEAWDQVEELFVRAADLGINPQELESLPALSRFPGYSAHPGDEMEIIRGIVLPKLGDVDVIPYRMGLLEFLRHRVQPQDLFRAASQLELTDSGITFRSEGVRQSLECQEGVCVFWTPRLSPWILSLPTQAGEERPQPQGMRVWEEWSLVSRDPLDPSTVGVYQGMIAWARVAGAPSGQEPLTELVVLKPGQCFLQESPPWHEMWASAQSFNDLARLCQEFLHWDRYSIRAMRPRATMEWNKAETCQLKREGVPVFLQPHSDGALTEVVYRSLQLMERFK